MSKKLRELQARKAAHVSAMRAIADKGVAESRDLSDEEVTAFDAEKAKLAITSAAIERETELQEAERTVGALNIAEDAVIVAGGSAADNAKLKKQGGFKSAGEFFQAVRNGSGRNARADERLTFQAAGAGTYANEASGVDGGFLVPPAFADSIFTLSLTDGALLPLTDNTAVNGNNMVFPKDETTPWGTNGVRAYWQAEASVATATKPVFGAQTMRLHKLMGLVPVTDELLADSSAIESYLPPLLGRSIQWKTNEAILFGDGAGKPFGIFNNAGGVGSPAVVQAKDAAQATQTLTIGNVTNMIARLLPGSFPNAVWMVTPDLLPSLFQLTLSGYPVYLPINNPNVGGAQVNPYGTLMGRPIMVSQHSPAFSSQGDIALVDFSYYRTLTRAGMESIRLDSSMHLYFDADETAFRAIFRVDGQPKIVAPVTQAKGSKTLSPFIQLQAR